MFVGKVHLPNMFRFMQVDWTHRKNVIEFHIMLLYFRKDTVILIRMLCAENRNKIESIKPYKNIVSMCNLKYKHLIEVKEHIKIYL